MRISLAVLLALALPNALAAQIQKAAPPRKDIPRVVPPTVVSTGFDNAAGATGWFHFGFQPGHRAESGGNPGGFYAVNGITGFGYLCGAFTVRPELVGTYSRSTTIRADLRVASNGSNLATSMILQKSGAPGYWQHTVPLASDGAWHQVSLTLNPGWTDDQALAAGWKHQLGKNPGAWSEALASVYRVGFLVEAFVQSTPTCEFGIDNFQVTR